MKKVNISLVGGQPMPVYMGLEATKPDCVVLVHSDNTKADAEIIKSNCGIPASLYCLPPVDYPKILLMAEALINQFADDEISINVSSGTKLWSIAFSLLAEGKQNIMVFYIDQTTHFHDLTHRSLLELDAPNNMDTILKYHNQHGYTYSELSDYSGTDWNEHWKIRNARNAGYKDFSTLTAVLDKTFSDRLKDNSIRTDSRALPSRSSVTYDKDANRVELTINGRNRSQSITVTSPKALDMVFNSGWFEYEVAKMFEGWVHAKEIRMNVYFPSRNNMAKNEIDIIVDMGNRLLFVECKTHLFNSTDIDKFRTAVKNYGGTGSIALFVTDDIMSPEAKEKCEESNVLTFCLEDVNKMRPNNQQQWDKRRKSLLSFLESHITTINKK